MLLDCLMEYLSRAVAVGLFSLGLMLTGCGSSKSPATIKVHGRITLNGEPVANASIVFVPKETHGTALKRPATADSNEEGLYQLSSFEKEDGALPGDYLVSIISYLVPPGGPERPGAAVLGTPRKYSDPTTSELTATVPPNTKGPLELNFDLKGKANR